MRRSSLKWFFRFVVGILAVFSGAQIFTSFLELLDARSNLIQLTLVEPENNLDIQRHPYYTICPIFDTLANVTKPDATLESAIMEATASFPESLFVSLLNSQALTASRFTTWVKMKDISKNQTETLIPCTTFDIPKNVTLGKSEGKVRTDIVLIVTLRLASNPTSR